MIQIVDFNFEHVEEARVIAFDNYEQERLANEFLPKVQELPGLEVFAEFGLGVSALDDAGLMIGFLCAYPPREDAFGTTNIRGTFVPIHAHGVRLSMSEKEKERIYSRMYQAAAEKWMKEGILSHAIALYAHDTAGEKSFYYNGFGIRCIDAIRPMKELSIKPLSFTEATNIEYLELLREDWGNLLEHHNKLIAHLGQSPTFMKFPEITEEKLYQDAAEDIRYFAAKLEENYIAYIKVGNDGETFVSEVEGMMNICGAYCCPQYRGTGVYHNLLAFMISTLKQEGYTLLGVDC